MAKEISTKITKLDEDDYYIESITPGINIHGGYSTLAEAREQARNALIFTLGESLTWEMLSRETANEWLITYSIR